MKKILSIIITTFNCEDYIFDTLFSITNDLEYSLRNKIEIIIIDDCSLDNTCNRINEFKKLNPDIDIFAQSNKTNNRYPGKGLNKGIKIARGKLLHFIDGDDIVNSYIYNEIINEHEKFNYDVLDFSASFFYDNLSIFKTEFNYEEFSDEFPYTESKKRIGYAIRKNTYWQKIYSKKFIDDNDIKFIENRTAQDSDFNVKVFRMKPTVRYFSNILLFYRCGINSISTNLHNRKLQDNIAAAKNKVLYFPETHESEFSYLINILCYTNPTEVVKNFKLYNEMEIFVDPVIPENLNFFSWLNYFCHHFYAKNDVKSMVKLINLMNQYLELLNTKDRKLMSYLSLPELKNLILLKMFFEFGYHKYRKNIVELSRIIDLRKLLIDVVFNYNHKYNVNELLNLIEYIIYKNKDSVLEYNLSMPKFVKSKKQIIAYLKTYGNEVGNYDLKYSVILVHYNRPNYVLQAIQSFIDCDYTSSELIIVDNASCESTKKLIREKISNNTNIKMIELNENIKAGARNYGIKKSKGNYICFLDDDDFLSKKFFTVLDDYLVGNKFDIARFNAIYVDEKAQLMPELHYSCVKKDVILNLGIPTFDSWYSNVNMLGSGALCVFNRRNLNSKSFVENIIYEDSLMLMEQFFSAKEIQLIPEAIYYRRRHNKSIMNGLYTRENEFLIQSSYLRSLGFLCLMEKNGVFSREYVTQINNSFFLNSVREIEGCENIIDHYSSRLLQFEYGSTTKMNKLLEGIDAKTKSSFIKKFRTNIIA